MSTTIPSPRQRLLLIPVVVAVGSLFYLVLRSHQSVGLVGFGATRSFHDLGNAASVSKADVVVPHYYSEGLDINSHICKLHGWTAREEQSFGWPRVSAFRIFDAMVFEGQLDLLEIRLNELDPVVDRFFIVEHSDVPNDHTFAQNRDRFKKFQKKISYKKILGSRVHTRAEMTKFIRAHVVELPPSFPPPLVIMSNADEIPAAHTVELLRSCDFGDEIRLELRIYMFSFEFFSEQTSSRIPAQRWKSDSEYRPAPSRGVVLADSGWHCSYCYRYVDDMAVAHMRASGAPLEYTMDVLQEAVCKGHNLLSTPKAPSAKMYIVASKYPRLAHFV
uniref:Glycosyltransferase family 17 protein n=1 Tax=Mycena chlorophos TaxID=658473 RepID=A0ABQ0M431_MYCCL|nr:glycosyltransferase family 17 protein [Mycena chlorophos]